MFDSQLLFLQHLSPHISFSSCRPSFFLYCSIGFSHLLHNFDVLYSYNNIDVVILLYDIDNNQINFKNKSNYTPFYIACYHSSFSFFVIPNRIDIENEIENDDGLTSFESACIGMDINIIKCLHETQRQSISQKALSRLNENEETLQFLVDNQYISTDDKFNIQNRPYKLSDNETIEEKNEKIKMLEIKLLGQQIKLLEQKKVSCKHQLTLNELTNKLNSLEIKLSYNEEEQESNYNPRRKRQISD